MEIPHTHTARRLRFDELPGSVRALIEDRLGSSVVSAASQDSGFTPGLASRLLLDDGSPYIRLHQRWYADATLSWLTQRRGWR